MHRKSQKTKLMSRNHPQHCNFLLQVHRLLKSNFTRSTLKPYGSVAFPHCTAPREGRVTAVQCLQYAFLVCHATRNAVTMRHSNINTSQNRAGVQERPHTKLQLHASSKLCLSAWISIAMAKCPA